MIRSVEIENLRGIRKGKLSDLTPLVVLVGPNNSGKSTVLDAILIGTHRHPRTAVDFVTQRRRDFDNARGMLLRRSGDEPVESATIGISTPVGDRHVTVRGANAEFTDVQPPGDLQAAPEVRMVDPVGAAPRTPLHILYTQASERGFRSQAKSLVRALAPEIQDVEILSPANTPIVYLVFDDGARPEGTAGDGLRMLLRLSLELAAPAGSVELLEEPELHMHPAAMKQASRAIWAAVERGIQVIASTHSLDLIDSLLAEAKVEELDKLSFYRLQLKQGILSSNRMTGREAAAARSEIEADLR
ncbi:MAG: AAA family ATPase [Phycisphaerae bacterium]|nr:AAA family ATPase [Phycisphaerae bacterium]